MTKSERIRLEIEEVHKTSANLRRAVEASTQMTARYFSASQELKETVRQVVDNLRGAQREATKTIASDCDSTPGLLPPAVRPEPDRSTDDC